MLLLTAVCETQYYDSMLPPDYDSDYNATFEYSFFSNTSNEELERFSELFNDTEEEEVDEAKTDKGHQEVVTVTMATTRQTTQMTRVNVHGAASLPVFLELRMLVWTLMILMVLNTQQL